MLWNYFGPTLQNPWLRQATRLEASSLSRKSCRTVCKASSLSGKSCKTVLKWGGALRNFRSHRGQSWSMVKFLDIHCPQNPDISLWEDKKKTGIDPDTRCINWPGQRWQPATFQRKLQIAWAMEFKKTSQMVSFGSFCLIVIVSSLWFISCCCANNLTMK